jgi:hypothetical protein
MMKDFSQLDPSKAASWIAFAAATIGWMGIFNPRFAFFLLCAMGVAALVITGGPR